ncbi:Hypothetical predicted protein [Olea europaea subsp. europaea]|uniref:Pentatricopeptide repeat-containing protein n=1 Tax=Olea europaea subsp. europaea TaxID=158383 RepID=A0A8S0VPY4_OLEEU|nr:Hypothetical predicted protein [Olea europaea subsp. europaea]
MPGKDVISWTSMMMAYGQATQYNDAIILSQDMMVAMVKPDKITAASVLSACAHFGMLDMGIVAQNFIHDHGVKLDIYVDNALKDMYCKCRSVEKSGGFS